MRLWAALAAYVSLAHASSIPPVQVKSRLPTADAFLAACAMKGAVLFVGFGSSGYDNTTSVIRRLEPTLRQLDAAYPGWRPVFGGDPSSDGGIGLVLKLLKEKGYSPIAVAAEEIKNWGQPLDDNTDEVFYYATEFGDQAASNILWGGVNTASRPVYDRNGTRIQPTPALLGGTAYYLGQPLISSGGLKAIVAIGIPKQKEPDPET